MKKKVVLGSTLLLVFLAGVLAFLPRLANHFGFALPIEGGLPYRVYLHGRYYSSNDGLCAGAGWCHPQPVCSSFSELAAQGHLPIAETGTVHTLFGPDHPIVKDPSNQGSPPMMIWVIDSRGCYLAYVLMGGP